MTSTRWQYRRLSLHISQLAEAELEARLDSLGEEGWELVTVVQHERHGYSHDVHFVFKRPALNAPR